MGAWRRVIGMARWIAGNGWSSGGVGVLVCCGWGGWVGVLTGWRMAEWRCLLLGSVLFFRA